MHREAEIIKKDLKHLFVFVAENYYYFGDKAVTIPVEYQDTIWKRQGCKSSHGPEVVVNFLTWLKANYDFGVLGNPKDNSEAQKANC